MNERLQALKQRSAASHQSVQATLQKTAPKATLGGIKAAAEKKFGQRKQHKQPQPKKQQPKKQPKPKAVSSTALDQWKQAMEKANIPKHRWRKLEDKISRLTGISRKQIEDILFDHQLFEAVYSIGEDEPELVDDYLSELEARVNELSGDDNKNVMDLVNGAINGDPEDLQIMSAIIEQIDMDVLNHVSEEVKTSMLALKQSASNYYEEVFTMVPTAKGEIPVYVGSIEFKEKFNIDLDSFEGQLELVQTITHLADDMVAKFNSELKAAANSELPYNKNDKLD